MDLLNKLLSLIPGNGFKSLAGAVITYAPLFYGMSPEVRDVVQKAGALILALGLLHKGIKERVEFR